jgi:polysaccharide export outer membrane protein
MGALLLVLALLLPQGAATAGRDVDATTGRTGAQENPGGSAPEASQAPAPSGETASPAQAAPEETAPLQSPAYQVGPGDTLEINVYGNDDLSRIPTVQTNGAILYPLLGEVQVAGLTVAEIQRKMTSLLEKDYLVNPQVEVKVREYNSQFVSVVGEVNSPGRKAIRGRMRLIDVLLDSGGFKASASGEVVITRVDGTFAGGERTITLRLSGGGSAPTAQDAVNLELPMRNGDIISAPPKFYVTVDGEVNRPGRYAIEGNLTVTGALSLAGGRTRFGADDVQLRRTDPETGKPTIIKVDLGKVRDGKRPDPVLMPNDVISVPRRFF